MSYEYLEEISKEYDGDGKIYERTRYYRRLEGSDDNWEVYKTPLENLIGNQSDYTAEAIKNKIDDLEARLEIIEEK